VEGKRDGRFDLSARSSVLSCRVPTRLQEMRGRRMDGGEKGDSQVKRG
jgi:hypothetical protein